jgi:hypothetical protein
MRGALFTTEPAAPPDDEPIRAKETPEGKGNGGFGPRVPHD